jgi:hypothetical protein
MAAYGWIKRGEKREIQTSSGRERLNLHGAMNAETLEGNLPAGLHNFLELT